MRGYGNRNIGNSIYYIGLMVRDEKENSDWFSERSEFCNTDWTGHEAVYIGCKTLLIFCSHFLGHQKRKNEINVLSVKSCRNSSRILLSKTVNRSKEARLKE